jgi:hypothetical protein
VELAEGEVVLPLLRHDGGGTAPDGMLREPVLQAICLPVPATGLRLVGRSGCLARASSDSELSRPLHVERIG